MGTKRVLVTGATGFIGAAVAWRLVEIGHEVHAICREGSNLWRVRGIEDDLIMHRIDLADTDRLSGMVTRMKPDWVFHLAAYGAYSWQTDLDTMMGVNIGATAVLAESAMRAGCAAFVHAGSSSEYGFKRGAVTETELPAPNSEYAATKLAGSHLAQIWAKKCEGNLAVLRLYSIFGPWEDEGRLIPRLIEAGLEGRFPPFASPKTARDFVYLEDAVDAFLQAARTRHEPGGAIYNIASGRQTTLEDLAAWSQDFFGIASDPDWGTFPNRAWDTEAWVGDAGKARERIGWSARISLEEGLRRTVEWKRGRP